MPLSFSTFGEMLSELTTSLRKDVPRAVLFPLALVVIILTFLYGQVGGWPALATFWSSTTVLQQIITAALAIFCFLLVGYLLAALQPAVNRLFQGQWRGIFTRLAIQQTKRHRAAFQMLDTEKKRIERAYTFVETARQLIQGQPVTSTLIVVATRPLSIGHLIGASDVSLKETAASPVPAGAFASVDDALNRMTSQAIASGEALTEGLLVQVPSQDMLEGKVLVPLTFTESSIPSGLRPGHQIRVYRRQAAGSQQIGTEPYTVVSVDALTTAKPEHRYEQLFRIVLAVPTASVARLVAVADRVGLHAVLVPETPRPASPSLDDTTSPFPPAPDLFPPALPINELTCGQIRKRLDTIKQQVASTGPDPSPLESWRLGLWRADPRSDRFLHQPEFWEAAAAFLVLLEEAYRPSLHSIESDAGNALQPVRHGLNMLRLAAMDMTGVPSLADYQAAALELARVYKATTEKERDRIRSWLNDAKSKHSCQMANCERKRAAETVEKMLGAEWIEEPPEAAQHFITLLCELPVNKRQEIASWIDTLFQDALQSLPESHSPLQAAVDYLAALLQELGGTQVAPQAGSEIPPERVAAVTRLVELLKEASPTQRDAAMAQLAALLGTAIPDAKTTLQDWLEKQIGPEALSDRNRRLRCTNWRERRTFVERGAAYRAAMFPVLQHATVDLRYRLDESRKHLLLYYPGDSGGIAATAIGNVLAAADTYCFRLYHIDPALALPRLLPLLSKDTRDRLNSAAERVALIEWTIVGLVFIAVAGAIIAGRESEYLVAIAVWSIALCLSWFVYSHALVGAGLAYAEQIRLAFDGERGKLLVLLGMTVPDPISLNAERDLWTETTRMWMEGHRSSSYVVAGAAIDNDGADETTDG